MKNISDMIEEFILEQLADGEINLSRNDLADFFKCAPSQINYVLSTRFTPLKGYIIESRRGGGGYIRVERLENEKSEEFTNLLEQIGEEIDYNSACDVLENLNRNEVITNREFKILKSAISNKSLACPIKIENVIRAKILKNTILELMREE